ncbi:MAG: hypothetical protein DWQ42_08775, partial [Planctomycetota bacterium]
MEVWVEREIEGCEFPDQRLKTRFGKLLGQLGAKIGESLPTACQDCRVLYHRLARVLADDGESDQSEYFSRSGVYGDGNRDPESPVWRVGATCCQERGPLPAGGRPTRRLPQSQERWT